MIFKKWKIKFENKIVDYSSFVILIFAVLKFWNISRSTFRRSKFWLPPQSTLEVFLNIQGGSRSFKKTMIGYYHIFFCGLQPNLQLTIYIKIF